MGQKGREAGITTPDQIKYHFLNWGERRMDYNGAWHTQPRGGGKCKEDDLELRAKSDEEHTQTS